MMSAQVLEWAVAARPLRGEVVSGDQCLVAPFPGGALVAVIDGLGHGPSAEAAARAAIEVLGRAPELPVVELVSRCHGALRAQRGIVMSLASFDVAARRMTWLGVGNVEGVLVRGLQGPGGPRERLLVWGGIVGQSVGTLRPSSLPIFPGDLVVFATDGIQSAFVDSTFLDDVRGGKSVESVAKHILERHALERDDALVLVARYQGELA